MQWQLKPLHRLIVTSRAYQQSSAFRAAGARADGENRLLWRQRARRLEAEAIRDTMLAVSGTLDPAMYGEPVGEETRATGEIVPIGEEKGGRRSLYLLARRSMPVTLLNTFDAPIMETNCTRRITSTTPTQALALLNSSFLATQAQHFARRVTRETSTTPAPGVTNQTDIQNRQASMVNPQSKIENRQSSVLCAYRLAFGRWPAPQEQAAAQTFLIEQTARYQKLGKTEPAAREQALADFCQALLSANEFVYVD